MSGSCHSFTVFLVDSGEGSRRHAIVAIVPAQVVGNYFYI